MIPFVFALLGLLACAARAPAAPPQPPPPSIVAPKAEIYGLILLQSRLYLEQKPKDAILALERAHKNDPQSSYVTIRLSQLYFQTQDYPQAEIWSKRSVELCPDCPDAQVIAGRVSYQKQDYAEAEKFFKRALDLETDDASETVLALTNIYLTNHEPEKAVGMLKDFIAQNPDNELMYYYLGRVYSEVNRIPDAVSTYQKLIRINPEFPHSYKALGIIHEFQGDTEKAVDDYATALRYEPDNVELAKHLAGLYLDLKKYAEAQNLLMAVTEQQPLDQESKLRLGLLHLKNEEYDEAKVIFEQVEKTPPVPDAVLYYLGIIYEKERAYPRAVRTLRRISPGASMYSEAQQAAALIQESQGRTAEAEKILSQAVANKRDDVPLMILWAKILSKQRRYVEAVAILDRGLLGNPKETSLWFACGEVHDDAGNFAKSIECLKKVIELNPDHANALNYLGYSYAQKGINLKEAEQFIQRALKLRPNDGYITDSLGWIYYKMGMFESAVGKLREATTLAPKEATILEHLGDALLKLGNRDEAKKAYEQALENSKVHVDRRRLGTKLQIFRAR